MRRMATVMVMVGLALALASCGDDDEPVSATGPTTVAPTTVAPTTAAQAASTTTRATTSTTTTTEFPAGVLQCETVAFTPDSEDAASEVRATGLTCDEAESFVRQAGMQTSSGGPEEVDVEGYHCIRTASQQEPLPRSSYECTNGPRTVTFVRS